MWRERTRQVLVEGHRAVGVAIAAGVKPSEVLHTRAAARGRQALLQAARAAGASISQVSPAVMAHLTSETTAPDVLAVAPLIETSPERAATSFGVVLAGVHDPAAAGGIMALAAATIGGAVFEGDNTVDLFAPKTIRAAQGAHYHLTVVRGAEESDVVERYRAAGSTIAVVSGEGPPPWERDLTGPLLVIIDAEGRWAEKAPDDRVSVPASTTEPSLSARAAVVLYERMRQERAR